MNWGWQPYVKVSTRKAQAKQQMNNLRKKGVTVQPVSIEGRKIATTFWGTAWCNHLEKFSDYANRLPRGRTYVRNGSVCHLEIAQGQIKAIVSGSSLYDVLIKIEPLPEHKWTEVKKRCAGEISSLLELLKGKFSTAVMTAVTEKNTGLFPLPTEIQLDCSCPDWATMCKHVAAVLYGVGARLDSQPELIFTLRAVDQTELIAESTDLMQGDDKSGKSSRFVDDDLGAVFGIEFADEPTGKAKQISSKSQTVSSTPATPKQSKEPEPISKHKSRTSPVKKTTPVKPVKAVKQTVKKDQPIGKPSSPSGKDAVNFDFSKSPTARQVRELRKTLNSTVGEFANILGVSYSTVANWEKRRGKLNLSTRSKEELQAVAKLASKKKPPQVRKS